MPLVAHNDLPSFERLRGEGQTVLSQAKAEHQDIRELHIGLLNMMPDKALAATERQFFRLIGESNPIAQFYVHPFTVPELKRGAEARTHIAKYYETFEQVREQGLDALVITGANVVEDDLTDEPFWEPLTRVIDWAAESVTSVLCSCLATHAVMQYRYGQRRILQPRKTWGVFHHHVIDKTHPLVVDINTRFDVPHSRWNKVTPEQFQAAGTRILAEADEGVHLATSPDGIRFVMFQGHPEYDTISLIKEHKREVMRYANGAISSFPPVPENYFSRNAVELVREYQVRLDEALSQGKTPPRYPEHLIVPQLHNTWHDTAEGVVGNWIGLVYQLTGKGRHEPFMDAVDPNQPLASLT